MKQVIVSGGEVRLDEVPAPMVKPGTVLIRMTYSCISIGTEMSGVKSTGRPLWKRAIQQPQNVMKVINIVRKDGIKHARRIVKESLAVELPTGYSGSGIVIAVGQGVTEFVIGDRVACAGSQFAFHAEVVCVPKNLVVSVPNDVGLDEASSVALGAIAMQGVRRINPTLGETFVVLGLGVLGQLTVQMLCANGCRVIGLDLDRERIGIALNKGMNWGIHPDDINEIQQVMRLTGGIGADGVIITAAGAQDAIVSTAFRMCRKKARVVLVGDVGMDIQREDIYVKELDFLISTSYGPGRYDASYEDGGNDYPLAFVRWTERRNMGAFLSLIEDRNINVKSMVTSIYKIEDASKAFGALQSSVGKPLMVLLSYAEREEALANKVFLPKEAYVPRSGVISLAMVGVGSYAKGMYLPNLLELKTDFSVRAVVSRFGHNAANAAKSFDAHYSTTDVDEVFKDESVDAVIIATRHDSHASLALRALQAGKHVLVEKPLALNEKELETIEAFYEGRSKTKPILLTGFNRRFSIYAQKIAELLENRSNPMIINYRMNAGYIPLDHWVHGPEGGGRNLGEACHIYDLFTFLINFKVVNIQAAAIKPATNFYSLSDNFVATLSFEDGSLATLTYTALGNNSFPKESMEIYVDGMVISLDDYRKLTVVGVKRKPVETRTPNKGQKEVLHAFAAAIRGYVNWPIPLWQQLQATRIGITVDGMLQNK